MAEIEKPINLWLDAETMTGLKVVAKRNGRAMCRQGAAYLKECVARDLDTANSCGLKPDAHEPLQLTRAGHSRPNTIAREADITEFDCQAVVDAVTLAIYFKDPRNGMAVKPNSLRVYEACEKLCLIVNMANAGLKAQAKAESEIDA